MAGTKQLGEDMIWGAGLYLAGSQEEAIRRVEPAHDERYKWFAPFGFVRYADEHGRTWGTPGAPSRIPSLRDGVAAEGVVLRHARAGDRWDQVGRGEIPGAGGLHGPLGGGAVAGRVRGAVALVRARCDAGVYRAVVRGTARGGTGRGAVIPSAGMPATRMIRLFGTTAVMPAQAGIHDLPSLQQRKSWIPACAGMTGVAARA